MLICQIHSTHSPYTSLHDCWAQIFFAFRLFKYHVQLLVSNGKTQNSNWIFIIAAVISAIVTKKKLMLWKTVGAMQYLNKQFFTCNYLFFILFINFFLFMPFDCINSWLVNWFVFIMHVFNFTLNRNIHIYLKFLWNKKEKS